MQPWMRQSDRLGQLSGPATTPIPPQYSMVELEKRIEIVGREAQAQSRPVERQVRMELAVQCETDELLVLLLLLFDGEVGEDVVEFVFLILNEVEVADFVFGEVGGLLLLFAEE